MRKQAIRNKISRIKREIEEAKAMGLETAAKELEKSIPSLEKHLK